MPDGKILYLVRHAKSSWADPELSDFERPLNKRGRHDAPEMGRRIKQRNVLPDLIVCSPAKRALQTLQLLDLPADTVVYDKRIYEASATTLISIVQALNDRFGSAMLIGHNPSMSGLASQLGGVHIANMPTCAVAAIRLCSNHWNDAGSCSGELLDLDYPKKKNNSEHGKLGR